jgi:hypothetical protein
MSEIGSDSGDTTPAAAVIREHWNPEGCSWCHDEGMRDALPCCRDAAENGTHADHVAALVIAALNLTEEYTWSWDRDAGHGEEPRPGHGFSVPTREEAVAEADSYMTIVRRLVGPWIEEQP